MSKLPHVCDSGKEYIVRDGAISVIGKVDPIADLLRSVIMNHTVKMTIQWEVQDDKAGS